MKLLWLHHHLCLQQLISLWKVCSKYCKNPWVTEHLFTPLLPFPLIYCQPHADNFPKSHFAFCILTLSLCIYSSNLYQNQQVLNLHSRCILILTTGDYARLTKLQHACRKHQDPDSKYHRHGTVIILPHMSPSPGFGPVTPVEGFWPHNQGWSCAMGP